MTHYLDRPGFDFESLETATDYDQNPNWSAYFGELIFRHLPLRKNVTVLDVACGTGYPTIELSQRLGETAHVYGIDIWKAALARAQQKVDAYNIQNVTLLEEDAANTSFPDETFDIIVSNVGVNNFESPAAVFRECHRVAKPGAILALTTNPQGHMKEFYKLFEETLRELNLPIEPLQTHIANRHTVETITNDLESAGFTLRRVLEDSFTWRFLNGTAFLNTFHIVYGFLQGWKSIVPEDRQREVFDALELRLNQHAEEQGEFRVTVPVRYIEAEKPA